MADTQNNRDLYKEIGEIKGKQEMMVEQLGTIVEDLRGVKEDVSEVRKDISTVKSRVSNIEGRASIWSIVAAAITTALINLGLRK